MRGRREGEGAFSPHATRRFFILFIPMKDNIEHKSLDWRLNNPRYTNNKGYTVLTEYTLLKQGGCCTNKCRHCPYDPKWEGSRNVQEEIVRKLSGN